MIFFCFCGRQKNIFGTFDLLSILLLLFISTLLSSPTIPSLLSQHPSPYSFYLNAYLVSLEPQTFDFPSDLCPDALPVQAEQSIGPREGVFAFGTRRKWGESKKDKCENSFSRPVKTPSQGLIFHSARTETLAMQASEPWRVGRKFHYFLNYIYIIVVTNFLKLFKSERLIKENVQIDLG